MVPYLFLSHFFVVLLAPSAALYPVFPITWAGILLKELFVRCNIMVFWVH